MSPSLTVVCVFNDPAIRADCLDRSMRDGVGEGVEYLRVDNTAGDFTTAGAALNHAAGLGRNDVIVFVHQDVYIHSLDLLREAAGLVLADGEVGLAGACGVTERGDVVGRIRDRLPLMGVPVDGSQDVDSVDELLFMVPRGVWEKDRLCESTLLGWHAYAVEYALRLRLRGLRTVVVDVPLTHNSLTMNMSSLDEAHGVLAHWYSDLLPLQTSCGPVIPLSGAAHLATEARKRRNEALERLHAMREVWKLRATGAHASVADLRFTVDDLLRGCPEAVDVVNLLEPRDHFTDVEPGPLLLHRRGRTLRFWSRTVEEGLPDERELGGVQIVTADALPLLGQVTGSLPAVALQGVAPGLGPWQIFVRDNVNWRPKGS